MSFPLDGNLSLITLIKGAEVCFKKDSGQAGMTKNKDDELF